MTTKNVTDNFFINVFYVCNFSNNQIQNETKHEHIYTHNLIINNDITNTHFHNPYFYPSHIIM